MSQKLNLIDDYVVFVVVAVVVFVIDIAAAAEFDVVIFADVDVVVFHLVVVVLVLFVVAALASYFEIDDGDSAVVLYFLETFAEFFGDLDDVVESAVCRLHLSVLVIASYSL